MSVTFTTVLMVGVRIPEDEFPGDVTDDEYLPYYEGHKGVEMSLIQSSSSLNPDDSCPVFAGKVLQKWSEHDGSDGFSQHRLTLKDYAEANDFLEEKLGIEEPAALMFFTVADQIQ